MLTLFNRREVYVTQNMQKQAEVRDTLALAGINYTFKVSSGAGKPGGEPERNRGWDRRRWHLWQETNAPIHFTYIRRIMNGRWSSCAGITCNKAIFGRIEMKRLRNDILCQKFF